MLQIPESLEDATAQAIAALNTGLDAGLTRILLDLRFTELKPLPIAYQIATNFSQRFGQEWQAIFADAGAAALAKRDWADLEVSMRGVNEGRAAIRPEDKAFLLVAPSSVEVTQVEKLLELAGDRPFVMFNPRLENSEVGVGLAARKMRERFLNTFEVCYFIQPLEQGALWRCYPQTWQVCEQTESGMQTILETEQRPSIDDIDRIFMKKTGKQTSLLVKLQQFFKNM
ncbi:DUF1995 family protein [Tumidithrix elongata RA019]|uniref:DUF1995 family protein n=1 Tax=Tumidithrix elongata BACA0141 TaxID=2716417 RepID=A0AAW9Q2U6_9CYAN|nr:DUF1995 family protein [Tumidithrix elongata RA019]